MLKEFGFPVLTANQAEEQPYRMVRLNQVLGYVRGTAEAQGILWEMDHNLLGLSDQRGTLRAIWFFEPSTRAKEIINSAWQDQGEAVIEHWALEDDEGAAEFIAQVWLLPPVPCP